MSLSHCRFCAHDNPESAHFCNECGSPLGLKPCLHCDAVNEGHAVRCYECGASLAAEPAQMAEMAPAQAGAVTAFAGTPKTPSDPVLHVPESFGERFALEPDGTSRPANAPTRNDAAAEDALASAPIKVDDDEVAAALFERERRQKKIAMVAVPLVAFAIVLGGAYVYRQTGSPPPVAAKAPATPNQAAEPQPASEPSNANATPANAVEAAATPPATDAQPAAPTPNTTAVTQTASQPAPSKSAARESKAATDRIVAREILGIAPPASGASSADALATQRIIQREVGSFAQSPQNRRSN